MFGIEALIPEMFDWQRFANDKELDMMISDTLTRYGLSDEQITDIRLFNKTLIKKDVCFMSVENEKIQDVTKNIETNEAQATELKSDELEQVTGGTVKEYEQLISAIAGNDTLRALCEVATHAPIGNLIAREFLEDFLEDTLGIKTDISLGVLGTGAFSSHNTYTDKRTGRSLTHEEVIEIIQRFC